MKNRPLSALLVCFAPLMLGMAPALAHVFVQPDQGNAGSYFTATFTVPHGCGASATVALRMKIPAGVTSVKPQAKPGWTITVNKRTLNPPLEGMHGSKITEAVDEINWRGGPLSNDLYDTFGVMMKLPDEGGGLVYFPVIQECDQGRNAWIDIPASGQARAGLPYPAPVVKVQMKATDVGSMPGMTSSSTIKAGELTISGAWSRATPGGASIGTGYVTITNNGSTPDRLLSVMTPLAGRAEVHEMAMNNGVMTMRPLAAGLAIEPGKTVVLSPGGYHLMLMNLKQPLKQGDKLPVTLTFEKAGKVDVPFDVQAVGSQGPAGGAMGHMDHSAH